ncbi:MAG: hypothetical protein WAW61_00695 [Methylococcaceae bacterium]
MMIPNPAAKKSAVSWRSNAGPEEELMVARVTAGGEVRNRTKVYRGSFARWPSKYQGMEKNGDEVFIAWTDPVKMNVRLAAVALNREYANYILRPYRGQICSQDGQCFSVHRNIDKKWIRISC